MSLTGRFPFPWLTVLQLVCCSVFPMASLALQSTAKMLPRPSPATRRLNIRPLTAADVHSATRPPSAVMQDVLMEGSISLGSFDLLNDSSVEVDVQIGSFHTLYQMGEELGSGTYASVFAAYDRLTGEEVAVKVLEKTRKSRNAENHIRHEIQMCQRLQPCRNVVRLRGVYEDAQHFYLVQDLCTGGDLMHLMESGQISSEEEVATIMASILTFLADCHQLNICYGDTKPQNFVLRSMYPNIRHLLDPEQPKGDLSVVAVDFGCCQEYRPGCMPNGKVTGTPMYMAPEILHGCHSIEVDVWASGVLMYQLLTGRFPFWNVAMDVLDHMSSRMIRQGICEGTLLWDPQYCGDISDLGRDLIEQLLVRDPEARITAREALRHPWFKAMGAQH